MESNKRIRLARRHCRISQSALATAVGVQRSAVSHWEAPLGKSPTVRNLCKIAEVTAVQFEWLATGRGSMTLSRDVELESISTALAVLVEDELEIRMIHAVRAVSLESKLLLVEIAEQLAAHRHGRADKIRRISKAGDGRPTV